MAQLSFNAAKAQPMEERSFTLIPEGEYLFQIVKSEIVPNKAKTAERLNMQAKLLTKGDYKGQIVFIGLNWQHPNQQAQDISDREFKSICDSVGKGNDNIADTEELHGIPFVGTIVHSKPSGEYKENGETKFKYGPKAEIKKYEVAEGHKLLDGAEVEDSAPKESAPPWGKD